MTETEFITLLSVVEKIGVLSLLAVALVMFYRGDILSKKTVESMIHTIVEQTVTQTVDKITSQISKNLGDSIGDNVAEKVAAKFSKRSGW